MYCKRVTFAFLPGLAGLLINNCHGKVRAFVGMAQNYDIDFLPTLDLRIYVFDPTTRDLANMDQASCGTKFARDLHKGAPGLDIDDDALVDLTYPGLVGRRLWRRWRLDFAEAAQPGQKASLISGFLP